MKIINFKDYKKPYEIAFVIVSIISIYLYFDDRTNSHYLIGPLIFLPFLWAGFGLTIIYIFCLQLLKINKHFIKVSSVIFIFLSGYFSMLIFFSVSEITDRTQRIIDTSNEEHTCLNNYKELKNLYNISNLKQKTLYDSGHKISGFTLSFDLISNQDLYLNVIPQIVINGQEPFFSDRDHKNPVTLKKDIPQHISMTRDKANAYSIRNIHSKSGEAEVYMSIRIYDWDNKKPDVLFLPKRPYPDQLCELNIANKKERPIYILPALKVTGYKSEDFIIR